MNTSEQNLAQWATMDQVRKHLAGGRGKPPSRNYMYDLIEQGLPVHRPMPGGRLWFDLVEVDEFFKSRCSDPAPADDGSAA